MSLDKTLEETLKKLTAYLEQLSGQELHDVAASNNIEISNGMTDAEIRSAILASADGIPALNDMNREQLLDFGKKLGHDLKGNEVTLRKQLKAILNITDDQKPPQTDTRSVEDWIDDRRIPSWQAAAAMHANKWADGKKLTEEQFIKGLEVLNKPMGR